jgi:hypothetical protein
MQLIAKLVQTLPLVTGEGKNGPWKKQEFILETSGQYPKKVCLSLWGDKINESVLQVGNTLDVQFDVESREYNGRWYTECKAWKVELAGGGSGAGGSIDAPVSSSYNDISQIPPSDDDSLPF